MINQDDLMDNQIKSLDKLMDQYKKEYLTMQTTLQDYNASKVAKIQFEELKNNMNEQVFDFRRRIDVNYNTTKTIENFIDKYLPIRIQNQIAEVLNDLLIGRQKD